MEKILVSKEALENMLDYMARRPLFEVLEIWNAVNTSLEVPNGECKQDPES